MARPAPNTSTITVACKLPHGLRLRLYKPAPAGGAPAIAAEVVLAGSNSSNAVGGYGINDYVDAELFKTWLAANADYAPVKAGLIFADVKRDRARDRAREQSKIVSGFEGIDPEKPPEGVAPDKYEGRPGQKPDA